MSAPPIILHESVEDLCAELWFAEPAGFMALPLDVLLAEPDSSAAVMMQETVAPLLESMPDGVQRERFIAQFAAGQQMLAALCEAGTVFCSLGLHRDDVDATNVGSPLLSLFTISWRETSVAPRGVTAALAVTSGKGHTHVTLLELPCGPGVLSETALKGAEGSGLPPQPLLQIHAHLPHPDCTRLAVLTLSTTATARREEYRAILRQVVETVRFEKPLGDAP
ncbi:hypothetical protein ACFUVV_21080 [Streptomyces sp. NPDC057376]|uniref:hypothetical protein n=1 Tax=unclassified Streptomyces TaxID=2593676 RepID=UPI00093AF5BA|nr:hypothetical protein [Streptomyces sp. CB02414]OKI88054.1 hypothetical protein AMK11_07645 [Streptomyces sp. CB02414]